MTQGLTPLELATEAAFGEDPAAEPLPVVDPLVEPLRALEDAIVPSLQTPPCVVSFSGGRDSSGVLAAAASAARRHGLPLPVPVTLRYPGEPAAEESYWQELVVQHLELPDWERIELRAGERDLLGPLAREVLRRHGVVSPFGTYGIVPVLERAAGGTVLTGEDGDGLFEAWEHGRSLGVLSGRLTPEWRDLRALTKTAAPRSARRFFRRRVRPARAGWLTPPALAAFRAASAEEEAGEPRRWDRYVGWWSRRRYLAVIKEGFDVVAADYGVKVQHPFLDPRFLAAVARRGGRVGFGDRRRAMHAVFGEQLPEGLLGRVDKADFTSPTWGPQARAFALSWSGGGVPAEVVDEDALRREWARPLPDARTSLLVHAAWLAQSAAHELEEPVGRRRHRRPVEGPAELPGG